MTTLIACESAPTKSDSARAGLRAVKRNIGTKRNMRSPKMTRLLMPSDGASMTAKWSSSKKAARFNRRLKKRSERSQGLKRKVSS